MNDSSLDIARFLTRVLQTRDLLRPVYNHYARRGNKVHGGANVTGPIWAGVGYIEYGLMVTGSNGKNYELSARLRWPGDRWIIEAEVALEEEDAAGNLSYPTLRDWKRQSDNWQQALDEFAEAVSSLQSFDDLVPSDT